MKTIKKAAKVWYLELMNPKATLPSDKDLRIEKQENIDLHDYREKYKLIGGPWNWANRLILPEAELEAILKDPANRIYYLYYKGRFSGYFELDTHDSNNIEVVYFGLAPGFIGKGFGKKMMQALIALAGEQKAKRLWLHTCEFDSPRALEFYQKSGFKIYKETIEDQVIIIN